MIQSTLRVVALLGLLPAYASADAVSCRQPDGSTLLTDQPCVAETQSVRPLSTREREQRAAAEAAVGELGRILHMIETIDEQRDRLQDQERNLENLRATIARLQETIVGLQGRISYGRTRMLECETLLKQQ